MHETGLFQGKLGFRKAIVLLEEGLTPFSNIAGLSHVPFPKGNFKEAEAVKIWSGVRWSAKAWSDRGNRGGFEAGEPARVEPALCRLL